MNPAHQAAELAARECYGKLLAWLSWKWGDLASAEDALAEAFARALRVWPRQGVPRSPEAWLRTVARRELLAGSRRAQRQQSLEHLAELGYLDDPGTTLPDERLRLLLACAHPALDEQIRTPLMLQCVLGIQVQEMAGAFMLSPTTLAQRLVRAKKKIREAGIGFELPDASNFDPTLSGRLQFVLETIYGAYGISWDGLGGAEPRIQELAQEALYLSTLVAQLLPSSAEAHGLRALLLFCQSRRSARYDEQGRFVPLDQQDTARWDGALLEEAERTLWQASRLRQPGPFQLEAAIQSAHCQRRSGSVPWDAIVLLYAQLNGSDATVGSLVSEAVALCHVGRLEAAEQHLLALQEQAREYQPWWVARAHLLEKQGRLREAREHLIMGCGRSQLESIRRYLSLQVARLDVLLSGIHSSTPP